MSDAERISDGRVVDSVQASRRLVRGQDDDDVDDFRPSCRRLSEPQLMPDFPAPAITMEPQTAERKKAAKLRSGPDLAPPLPPLPDRSAQQIQSNEPLSSTTAATPTATATATSTSPDRPFAGNTALRRAKTEGLRRAGETATPGVSRSDVAPGAYRSGNTEDSDEDHDSLFTTGSPGGASHVSLSRDQAMVLGPGEFHTTNEPVFAVIAELAEDEEEEAVQQESWWTGRRIKIVAALVVLVIGGIAGGVAAAVAGGDDDTTMTPSMSPTITAMPTMEPSFQPSSHPTIQGSWLQLGQSLEGREAFDRFGGRSISLSANGRTLAVGAVGANHTETNVSVGHVYVYRLEEQTNTWNPLGQVLQGELEGDEFGNSVALSADGTVLATAAVLADVGGRINAGRVRVYRLVVGDDRWSQLGQEIVGASLRDELGFSIALSADASTLAVCAWQHDGAVGSDAGLVQVYSLVGNNSTVWTRVGQDLVGVGQNDRFGYSMSLSSNGGMLAIGTPRHDGPFGPGAQSGHVLVYRRSLGDLWEQLGNDIDGTQREESCGESASLSQNGTIVAIGCRRNNFNGRRAGAVRVYRWLGTDWTPMGQIILGEREGDEFGRTVSISSEGTMLAAAAYKNDGTAGVDSGHVRVYRYELDRWSQVNGDIEGESEGDSAGLAMSLSATGNTLAVGSGGFDVMGRNDTGHVRVFRLED